VWERRARSPGARPRSSRREASPTSLRAEHGPRRAPARRLAAGPGDHRDVPRRRTPHGDRLIGRLRLSRRLTLPPPALHLFEHGTLIAVPRSEELAAGVRAIRPWPDHPPAFAAALPPPPPSVSLWNPKRQQRPAVGRCPRYVRPGRSRNRVGGAFLPACRPSRRILQSGAPSFALHQARPGRRPHGNTGWLCLWFPQPRRPRR
jgi:hypothetical protein